MHTEPQAYAAHQSPKSTLYTPVSRLALSTLSSRRTCSGSMTRYVWRAATAQPRSMKVVAVPLNFTTPYVRERRAQTRKRSKLKPHASETRVQYSLLPRL